jgi:GcrA cell cycle regulator
MSWNEEKVAQLKKLWEKNTAAEISKIIGGVTRNAIIGKANRLNLSSKIKTRSVSSNQNFQNTNNEENYSKQKLGKKSRFQSLIIEKDFEPENPKQLEELTDDVCKYPINHPTDKNFYFCGRSSLKDFSYCKLHLLYSYQQKNKKEDVSVKDEEVPQYIGKKIKSA